MPTKKKNIISNILWVVFALLLIIVAFILGTRPQVITDSLASTWQRIKNFLIPDVFKMGNFTEHDARKAVFAVRDKYGVDLARTVEKMFRWETAHFTSRQYRETGTAGLTAAKGWPVEVPKSPTVTFRVDPALDSAGRSKIDYIVWSPEPFALFLASYIKKYNGNFARWFSTDENKQVSYREKVNSIKTKFV
jgi:hypothetical protein